MPFSPEVYRRILDALHRKTNPSSPVGAIKPCPMCGTERYSIGDGFVSFQTQYPSVNFEPQIQHYPNIMLICQNCGHSLFFNVILLGLGDLVGVIQGRS